MKDIHLKCVVFAVLLLLQIVLLDQFYYRVLVKNAYGCESLKGVVLSDNPEKSILFLGNSHVRKAVDPSLVDGSVNLATGGQTMVQSYYKVKTLLDYGVFKPKAVVLSIDPEVLGAPYQSYTTSPPWMWDNYFDYLELGIITGDPQVIKKSLTGFFPYRGKGVRLLNEFFDEGTAGFGKTRFSYPGFRIHVSEGYKPADMLGQDVDIVVIKKEDMSLDETYKTYFMKFLQLTREKNLTLVLVRYPLTKRYVLRCEQFVGPQEVYLAFIEDAIAGYDNAYTLDYQDKFDDRLHFMDRIHMNRKGATLLSKMLEEDLARLHLYD